MSHLRFSTRVITKPCYVKVWIFSRWLVSMLFRNAGGVAAAAAAVPHAAHSVYLRDTRRRGTTETILLQKRIRRTYRKRRTACCNATDVRVSGTWPLIAGTYRAASAAASRTASSFAQGRGTTLYAATAPDLITPDIDSAQSDCSYLTRHR